MRINVYVEEIILEPDAFEILSKQTEGRTLTGLRVKLRTPACMVPPAHHDDDSSAVTFWFALPEAALEFVELLEHAALDLLP